MSRRVKFRGACHPPAKEDNYDGTFFTHSDLTKIIPKLKSIPVLYEHNGEEQIGKITGAHVDEKNRLIVHGYIERKTFRGAKAVQDIRQGKLKFLSLGIDHLVGINKDNLIKIIDKKVQEVSITGNPALEDTEIQNIQADTESWKAAKECLATKIQNNKLKTDVYKAKENLLRTIKERGRQKQVMEEDKERSLDNSTGDDKQTTTSSSPPPSPSHQSDDDDIPEDPEYYRSETQRLQKENERLRKKTYLLTQANKDHDPEEIEKLLKKEREERERQQDQMRKDIPAMEDFLNDIFTAQGIPIPKALGNAVKEGYKDPEHFEPLHELTTKAHLRNENEKKEVADNQRKRESEFQKVKKELERRKKYEDELLEKNEILIKRLGYRDRLDGNKKPLRSSSTSTTTSTGSGQNVRKRDQEEGTKNRSNKKHESSSTGDDWDERFEAPTGGSIQTPFGARAPDKGVGMQQSEDHIHWMSQLFGSSVKSDEKMGTFDIKNLVGRNYSTPEGVIPGTTLMQDNVHTLRSATPRSSLQD